MSSKNVAEIDNIVAIAKQEVGYHEGRSGSTWTNKQKYSPAVPTLEWSQNQAWCSTFTSWLAMMADLVAYYPRTASTDIGAHWFKLRGQWHEYPAIGALGYLGRNGDMFHVFLVTGFDDTYIYTVEGNTNNNGSPQGDGVYALKRRRDSSSIEGYGYPDVAGGLVSADPKYKRPGIPETKPTRPGRNEAVDQRRRLTKLAQALRPGRLKEKVKAARDKLPRAKR